MQILEQYAVEAIEVSDIGNDTHYLNCIDRLHQVLSLVSFAVQGDKLEFIPNTNLIYGIPDAIQKYPFCYSLFLDFNESRIARHLVERIYKTRHTVVIKSKNWRVAEIQLGLILDVWPSIVRENRTLGGYLGRSGSCVMNKGRGDFDKFNSADHRIMAFESTIKATIERKANRWPTL